MKNRTENPRVGSSILSQATIRINSLGQLQSCSFLVWGEKLAKVFQQLKSNKIRIGSMDLKIASIAIANEAILVSRNLKDFEKVSDLTVQDWTN